MALSPRQRMVLHRQMQQWHWVSAALCLAALLLFSLTGITLNHAGSISAVHEVTRDAGTLPEAMLAALPVEEGELPVAADLGRWLEQNFDINARGRAAEWSADEVYLSAPTPGRDAWLTIDRATGMVQFEATSRGTLAYLNDLHKGRHTGAVWKWFIDFVAVACVVFAITGLVLLMLASRQRRSTWPTVGAGVGLLVLLAVFFAH